MVSGRVRLNPTCLPAFNAMHVSGATCRSYDTTWLEVFFDPRSLVSREDQRTVFRTTIASMTSLPPSSNAKPETSHKPRQYGFLKRFLQKIFPSLALDDLAVVYGFEDRGSWSRPAPSDDN